MPVVLRERGRRYFFFSNEGEPRERPHVHVRAQRKDAKVWLEPEVGFADSYGFNVREKSDIIRTVEANRESFLRAWHAQFPDQR